METLALNIKFLLFLALELSVVLVIVAGLIAGLYQIVREQVQETRRKDELAPEAIYDLPSSLFERSREEAQVDAQGQAVQETRSIMSGFFVAPAPRSVAGWTTPPR